MRIGLISGEYPPMQGGVGDFARELTRALAGLGHEVHAITGQWPIAAPDRPSAIGGLQSVSTWRWGCWREITALADKLGLDVLDLQYQTAAYGMHPAIHFPPRRRPPLVVTFHDLLPPYLFPKAGPLRGWIVRRLARQADAAIVTNQEDFLRLEVHLPAKRLNLIPIGSNIARVPPPGYDRTAERARWGVGADDLLLGYFGFLNASKGSEELIHALALLRQRGLPAHLLMVGGRVGSSDPTNRATAQRVEALIDGLGLGAWVHWTGYSDPAAVSAGLLAVDACVLPYRDGVSFRRGTLHACLAHGRAIVTTRPAVELPELRDGHNVLLVEPRDPAALAAAVARLAVDPALRARLEQGALALAAEFTWERIARRSADVFRRLG